VSDDADEIVQIPEELGVEVKALPDAELFALAKFVLCEQLLRGYNVTLFVEDLVKEVRAVGRINEQVREAFKRRP
jgi:hypothetical protein